MTARWAGVAFLLGMAAASGAEVLAPWTKPGPSPFEQQVKQEAGAIVDALAKDDSAEEARGRARMLFDAVISRASEKQLDLVREAAFAWRLSEQLQTLPTAQRKELAVYLRQHDALARLMAFSMDDKDDVPAAYALLDRLRKAKPQVMDTYAALAVAICVVHDVPLVRHVNEVEVKAPDPLAIFDYFTGIEGKTVFGLKNMPVELLIYVVDTTAPIEEMAWAQRKYGRDENVGKHFFDVPYDDAYYQTGANKKISKVGYTLANILTVGGVCADQAYFAVSVGKALGVPTAYTHGASGEVAHAWVGFLQGQGNRAAWNFDTGRYAAYKGIRGTLEDPQTRQAIPDAYASFAAELIGTKAPDRQTATALTDAVKRLLARQESPEGVGAELPAGMADAPAVVRKPDVASELRLVKMALQENPGHAEAWFAVRYMASKGLLTYALKKEWSDLLMTQSGQKYPDFAVAVVVPMIETVDDPAQQNTLWNAAFEKFKNRYDLAAYLRMKQAKFWEQQGDTVKAGKCYLDIIDRYANAGPFVLQALAAAEEVLPQQGKADRAVALFEATWKHCDRPEAKGREFSVQSNWYRVGVQLQKRMLAAGMDDRAEVVGRELEAYAPPAAR